MICFDWKAILLLNLFDHLKRNSRCIEINNAENDQLLFK